MAINKTQALKGMNKGDVFMENIAMIGKSKYEDSRTYLDSNDVPHVFPVGFSNHQVYICCPYCNGFHRHGCTIEGSEKKYEGHRVSHCYCGNGYFIEKLKG